MVKLIQKPINNGRYIGKSLYIYKYETCYSEKTGKKRFSIKKVTWSSNADPQIGKVEWDDLNAKLIDIDPNRMNYFVNEIKKKMLRRISYMTEILETFEGDCEDYDSDLDLSFCDLAVINEKK